MFDTTEKLILASASPRRQTYLQELGIDFEIEVADIDEKADKNESALNYVSRIAEMKYQAVAQNHLSTWILAADTIVFLDGMILGKPSGSEDALKTLLYLRDKTHKVATAFCLGSIEKGVNYSQTVVSRVVFSPFSVKTARAYVNTGEPLDKAGAYAIQGKGTLLVKELLGSYSNVVGLPLTEVVSALIKYGIVKIKC